MLAEGQIHRPEIERDKSRNRLAQIFLTDFLQKYNGSNMEAGQSSANGSGMTGYQWSKGK